MNQPDGGNCPTCMKPRTAKDGDGFITRFVDTCQCSLVSTDQSDTQKVVLCRRCGRRIGTGSPGSFTQWLFSEHSCQCTLKDPLEIENTQTEDTIAPYSPATASLELSETEFPVERYIPVALLGAGMTGKVYLCQDKKLETRVAIKVLHAVDSASLISFHREAKLVSTLKHSSIINVLDFGIMGQSKPYMVMPYRPGCTLSRLLSERGRVDPRTALIIVQKICAPLAYAHSKGVFHRDIKPDNILVSEYETSSRGLDIQVFDFGIALAELSTEESRMFQGQTVVGTPPYMSPDQVLGRKFDARSDIYSLGCVLYQMIAGHPPFVGDSVFELLEKHATAELPPLPTLAGDELVDEVNVILAKCLAKEPADRYQTMDELGLAIDQALNISDYSESAIGLSRLDIPDVRPVSPIKSAESHRVFLLVTSLLLALFSVALLYWVMGRWGLAQTSRIKDMTKDNLVGRENSKKEAKDRSDKIEDLLKEASKLRREKQFKKAISVLRKVEELCIPGSQAAVAVQFPLAQCFADEGDEQQAISRSRAVLEFYYVDPPSPAQERRVTLWVASYLSDLGMVKETQVYYERSVPLRKKELSALGTRFTNCIKEGDELLSNKEYKRAIATFRDALNKLNKGPPTLVEQWKAYCYLCISECEIGLSDYHSAARDAEIAAPIVGDPDKVTVAHQLNMAAIHIKASPAYKVALKKKALALVDDSPGRLASPTISTLVQLSDTMWEAGDKVGAYNCLVDATSRLESRKSQTSETRGLKEEVEKRVKARFPEVKNLPGGPKG